MVSGYSFLLLFSFRFYCFSQSNQLMTIMKRGLINAVTGETGGGGGGGAPPPPRGVGVYSWSSEIGGVSSGAGERERECLLLWWLGWRVGWYRWSSEIGKERDNACCRGSGWVGERESESERETVGRRLLPDSHADGPFRSQALVSSLALVMLLNMFSRTI